MLRTTRALLSSLLLASPVLACGEPAAGPDLPASPARAAAGDDRAAPHPAIDGPDGRATPDPAERAIPDPAERTSAVPAERPTSDPAEPEGEEACTADIDCATTALPAEPVVSQADCCFPTCEKRAAPREEVDRLQAAYGATCKEVLCAPQSCDEGDIVPVCRDGRCAAYP